MSPLDIFFIRVIKYFLRFRLGVNMNQHDEKISNKDLSFFSNGQGTPATEKKRSADKKSVKTLTIINKVSGATAITFEKVYAQLFNSEAPPKLKSPTSWIESPHTADVEINKAWVSKQLPIKTLGCQNESQQELVVSWMICLHETVNNSSNFDRMALGALAILGETDSNRKVRLILRITDTEYRHNIAKKKIFENLDESTDFDITNIKRTCLNAHSKYRSEARVVGREWMDSVELEKAEERLGCKICVLLGEDVNSNLRETFLKKLQRSNIPHSDNRPPLDVEKLAQFVHEMFNRQYAFQQALTPQLNERGIRDKNNFKVQFNTVASQNCNIAYLLEEIISHMILLYTIGDLIDIAFAPDPIISKRHSSEKIYTPKFYDVLDNWSRWLLNSFCNKENIDINFQTNRNLLTFIRAEYNPDKLSRKHQNTISSSILESVLMTNPDKKLEPPQTDSVSITIESDNTPIFDMLTQLVINEAHKRLSQSGQLDLHDAKVVLQCFENSIRLLKEERKEAKCREEEAIRQIADLQIQLDELKREKCTLSPTGTTL